MHINLGEVNLSVAHKSKDGRGLDFDQEVVRSALTGFKNSMNPLTNKSSLWSFQMRCMVCTQLIPDGQQVYG